MWEVIGTLRGTGLKGERAIASTAEWGSLTTAEVRVAVGYYAAFSAEVEERITFNQSEAARLHANHQRAQEAIA